MAKSWNFSIFCVLPFISSGTEWLKIFFIVLLFIVKWCKQLEMYRRHWQGNLLSMKCKWRGMCWLPCHRFLRWHNCLYIILHLLLSLTNILKRRLPSSIYTTTFSFLILLLPFCFLAFYAKLYRCMHNYTKTWNLLIKISAIMNKLIT